MFVFVSGAMTKRDQKEAEEIKNRILKICHVLDDLGHTYAVDSLIDTNVNKNVENVRIKIPQQYLDNVSEAVIKSVSGLRGKNRFSSVREEIAWYQWNIDELRQAGACIWELSHSSTGCGFEIATALEMRKPCLVLYQSSFSMFINGCTSRFLVTQQWDHGEIENTVRKFLHKAEEGLDIRLLVNVNRSMSNWLEGSVAQRGFKSKSDYVRFLIEEDQKKSMPE